MINILIDPLPTTVTVAGREFDIATDFRTGILYEQLMQDPDLEHKDKIRAAIELYYGEVFPFDLTEAMSQIVWFYSCGRDLEKFAGGGSGKGFSGKRLYDYDEDAVYFYTAFLTQYGIDLQDIEYLHWWKFQAMFMGINDDQKLSQIMSYRAVDLGKIKNRTEREHYRELQLRYRLPDIRSRKQKQRDVGSMFGVFAP